jgi:hypothetical protein
VFIQNRGAGVCTVTAGTATVASAGSLALPQNDAGILYFTSASAAIFYDFIQVGATSPLTTKGDLYTFSTSDARLPVGSNDQILVADSSTATGLKWAAPSAASFVGCLAYASNVTVSVTGGTLTVIPMANEEFDTDGFHSTSTNTGRITIPSGKGGKYLLTAQWDVNGVASGDYFITIIAKNGTVLTGSNRGGSGTNGGSFEGRTYSTIIDLAASDYVDFRYQQGNTGNRDFWLRFGAVFLGA